MVPSTRPDPSNTPRTRAGNFGSALDRSADENRQPEMSEPEQRPRLVNIEPTLWWVPDTRDDIEVGDGIPKQGFRFGPGQLGFKQQFAQAVADTGESRQCVGVARILRGPFFRGSKGRRLLLL